MFLKDTPLIPTAQAEYIIKFCDKNQVCAGHNESRRQNLPCKYLPLILLVV